MSTEPLVPIVPRVPMAAAARRLRTGSLLTAMMALALSLTTGSAGCDPLAPAPPPCLGGPTEPDGLCAPVRCGPGSREENGSCVASGERCGPGTVAQGDRCVPAQNGSPLYEVRALPTQFPADGRTKLPVFALGQEMDGTPSLREVILFPSRSDAGSLLPPRQTLTALGATGYFVPCSATLSPSCLGPFQIQLALGDNATAPVATSWQIELVEQKGVGSPVACMTGKNTVFLDGDSGDYIHPKLATITRGTWSVTATPAELPTSVRIHLTPSISSQGLWWDLEFSSQKLNQPLGTNVYEDAQRAPFADPGRPGLSISGDGRGCNRIAGRFQVHALATRGGQPSRFLASFEQRCEAGSTMLRGCINIEQ